MKIYLYNDRTAAITDDHSGLIITVPPTAGTLTIGEASTPVVEDGTTLDLTYRHPGILRGEYVTSDGIRYALDRLRVNANGVPVTLMEERDMAWRLRQIVDDLQIRVEELTGEVARLRGIYEEDALSFIIPKTQDGTKETHETNS